MRDIEKYEHDQFFSKNKFERYQEVYRRKKVKQIISQFDSKKEDFHILEIGCGLKPLFLDYSDRYFFSIAEPADNLYKNAERLAHEYKKVKCYHGRFEDLTETLSTEHYDMVICSSLLHEVEEPVVLLKCIHSICDEATVIHINVPNEASFHRLLAKEMNIIERLDEPSELNRVLQQNTIFDMQKLKVMIEENGGKVIESGSYFLKPFTHLQMQQCMEHEILNEDILEGLYKICEDYFLEYGSEIFVNYKFEPN